MSRSGPPRVVVHDLAQAKGALAAARELGVAIELWSAPDAAAYAGVGWLQALGEAAGAELVIDCGEDAGLVMAALRTGARKLAFTGPPELSRRLADMAEQVGAELRCRKQSEASPELSLLPDDEAYARCRAWLTSARRALGDAAPPA